MTAIAGLYIGRSKLHLIGGSAPSAANFSLNSTTGGCGWGFIPETADAITKVGFRLGARTGSNAISYTVGIETVSASTGLPTGTYKTNGGTDCKATFTPATDSSMDGTWQNVTLDAAYVPTAGEVVAITIRADGTVTGAQYISVTTNEAGGTIGVSSTSAPYALRLTTGTWSLSYSGSASQAIFGYGTSSEYFGYPWLSSYATATASTIGRRIGAAFVVPTSLCSTFKVRGFTISASMAAATGKNPVAGLWSSGSALQTLTLDTEQGRSLTSTYRGPSLIPFDRSSLSTLTAGTEYYIGLEVADAASGAITLYGTQYNSTTEAAADNGGNGLIGAATYNGSAWSTDYSARPWMELILSDLTQSGGGGSSGGFVIGA